jgi:Protein of unknown function (Hypoth_ymh)
MDADRAVALLKEHLTELSELAPDYRSPELKEWKKRTELTLRRVFGDEHHLVEEFKEVEFVQEWASEPEHYKRDFESGRADASALLKGAIYQLEVLSEPADFAALVSIDPELWEHVRRQVEQEQWAQVVSETAIFVESKVREWAGLPDSSYGKDLMVAVLRPGAGRFPLGRTPGEREGWLSFGVGFASGLGNAARHRIQQRGDAKRYAMGVLGAGSLLLTQLRHQHANSFQT